MIVIFNCHASTGSFVDEQLAKKSRLPLPFGDNVWIGANNATILPNVTLGNGVVVWCGSGCDQEFFPTMLSLPACQPKIIRYIDEKMITTLTIEIVRVV
jgi:hypothetical protein